MCAMQAGRKSQAANGNHPHCGAPGDRCAYSNERLDKRHVLIRRERPEPADRQVGFCRYPQIRTVNMPMAIVVSVSRNEILPDRSAVSCPVLDADYSTYRVGATAKLLHEPVRSDGRIGVAERQPSRALCQSLLCIRRSRCPNVSHLDR